MSKPRSIRVYGKIFQVTIWEHKFGKLQILSWKGKTKNQKNLDFVVYYKDKFVFTITESHDSAIKSM